MRRKAQIGWIAAALLAIGLASGCLNKSKKLDTNIQHSEEFNPPPKEARYDNPPESGYKKPAPKKEFRPGPGQGGPGGGASGPSGP